MAEVELRAERWIAAVSTAGQGFELLDAARTDPESFEFTRRLIELVAGTEDPVTSALGLREIAQEVPESIPARERIAVRAGGAVSLGLPWAVMPVARMWLRDRVSSLVLAMKLPNGARRARLPKLDETLRRHADAGLTPVIAPAGDPVHGDEGAEREAMRLAALAAQPLLRHLAVDPERIAPGCDDWTIDDDVTRAARALRPVLEAARDHDTAIHLIPSSVRWARAIPELLQRALADAALDSVRIGAGLVAELPESSEIIETVGRWAQRRVADGGAASEIVIGPGAGRGARIAAQERIASIQTGLPVAVIEDRAEQLAQLFRLAETALQPGRASSLRPVFATEEPRALAQFIAIAERLGSADLFSLQLRSGVAPGLAEQLAPDAPEVRIALPVVAPQEFAGALDTLLGAVAEAADPARDEQWDPESAAERELFRTALAAAASPAPSSHRTQLRAREWDPSERDSALFYRAPDEPARFDTGGLTAAVLGLTRGATGELRLEEVGATRTIPAVSRTGFANEPDTDTSLRQNRDWARSLLRRAAASAHRHEPAPALAPQPPAGVRWAAQSPQVRAVRLRRIALATAAARDRLLVSLAIDTGSPMREIDREIGDIIDAARYSGQLAEGLATMRGATFAPDGLTLIAASNEVTLATQAEEALSALAAGSGVLWAVPERVAASAAALLEEWQVAALPADAVRLETARGVDDLDEFVRRADRAVVLGDRAIAEQLVRLRPDLLIEGRFLVPGATAVTPSADLDAAITDIVASAFRGQTLRRAAGVILMGGAARSRRFTEGLADAVRALRVGDTAQPGDADPLAFDLGPLAAPPSEAGLRALTSLGKGEEWLVEPEQLDDDGLLWRPGVRVGVAASSPFWRDALGMPVIGIAHAHTLNEALRMQRGAVAGLQSHDPDDVTAWLEAAPAASLSINRATTAARAERQPGGGWLDAGMGMPALSGGPNRLITLGSWLPREGTRSETLHLRGLDPEVQLLIEAAQQSLSYEEFDQVRRAALADALTWRTAFGVLRDDIELGIERNLLRHWPVPTHLRLAEGGSIAELVRVLAAALIARTPVTVSTGELLPDGVAALLAKLEIEVSLERDDDWVERLAITGPAGADGRVASRVRLIGGDGVRTAEWLGGLDRTALWAEPVTMAGPVELLVLLREQAVSARAHRHGLAVPVPGLDDLLA